MLCKTIQLDASDHPVKSVTIYQSSTAEVTRTFSVSLQSGRNIIEVSGLSKAIDADSPRIHGLPENVSVLDICCDVRSGRSAGLNSRSEMIEKLRSKKKELSTEKSMYREEYEALEGSIRSPLQAGMSPDDMNAFLDGFLARKRLAVKNMQEIDARIVNLEREIASLEKTSKRDTALSAVTVTMVAKDDCSADFQLTYLVSGSSWSPFYDLHASSTTEGKTSSGIKLRYSASILQKTGEDWSDTALTLCTASSQTLQSLSIPAIDSLKLVDTRASQGPTRRSRSRPRFDWPRERSSVVMMPVPRSPSVSPPPPPRPDSESEVEVSFADVLVQTTAVDRNPLVLSYRVDSALSLPSDGLAHKITIAILDFSATLKYVCVPRKGPSAFIEASIKNTSDYELLSGPVSVFMNDGFVTKTTMKHVSAEESFDCVLGVDTAIKVSSEQKSRTEQEPERNFAEPTQTATQTLLTTVTNGHKFDVSDVIVRGAIPLGNDASKIKVALRKPEGLARASDGENVPVSLSADSKNVKVRWTTPKDGKGGEKDGLYEWICNVPAGKAIVLETEWDVKGPAKVKWEEKTN
ncbi:hypothetical protein L226DRAFT_616532 [Lentinus tigrinus ALCF2SS1-7]|uniref:Mucoidy inhibitor A n=1 Tax=Lentinus tigrinus ALCF2SS1-6 TaxID=1328759 RepID=A0A5C2RTY1_9APHY|nr:hypothetical protein L227DRAFT_580160 [Lentinus tigrinus ALCF2SS1-6]RPD69948.1 hypothetical protein L226DRAFT_616532 [Lentinus tigrinus ALCF2SS1-7]